MKNYKSKIDGHPISCVPLPTDGKMYPSEAHVARLRELPMQGSGKAHAGMAKVKMVEVNGYTSAFTLHEKKFEYFNQAGTSLHAYLVKYAKYANNRVQIESVY